MTLTMTSLPGSANPLSTSQVWRDWFVAMTAGEFLGFGIPALAGALGVQFFSDAAGLGARVALAGLMVAAGGLEGAVLGLAQALALRRYLPGLSVRHWVGATAAAAAFAWAIGMLPSTLGDPTTLPPVLLWTGAAVLGPLLLCSLGLAQWWVLRRHLAHAGAWVWISALAWLAGLAVVMAGMSLTQAGDSVGRLIAIAAFSGLLMGATAAAVSGWGLVRLLRRG